MIFYKLLDLLPVKMEQVIWNMVDKIYEVKCYIRNRYIVKTNTLTATSLPPGQWYDFDTRMLHCLFDGLVDFVEIESAGCRTGSKWLYWRSQRDAKAGIAHLEWASNLEDSPHQAHVAKETLAIYNWWKNERPNRPDPLEVSGWSAYCDENPGFTPLGDKPERERKSVKKMLNQIQKMESEHYNEDTKMMIRLINIRDGLWV